MKTFKFKMMQDSVIVAEGTASTAMSYDFQKTFIEGIGTGGTTTHGKFITLDELDSIGTSQWFSWRHLSIDAKDYGCWIERIN